ncbi:MAG TPA: DUF4381 domain-containing protein [Leucothrix sp.]|nr:DUF4381 domain-containing protein [Leucothrix sp.]
MTENNKTSVEKVMDDYLADLIIPERASTAAVFEWFFLAVLLIVIFLGIWKWLQFRKQVKQKALRQLHELQKNLTRQEPKYTALKLAKLLRSGLKVTRLSLFFPKEKAQWQAFKHKLNSACYSTESITEDELTALIKQTRIWLEKT